MSHIRVGADAPATVVAAVPQSIQRRLEVAMPVSVSVIHTDSLQSAISVARRDPRVRALMISPDAVSDQSARAAGNFQSKLPGVLTIAIVSERRQSSETQLLGLGACGVRYLVDVNETDGWRRLRALVAEAGSKTTTTILGNILRLVEPCTKDTRLFFDVLVRSAPRLWTTRGLAGLLGIGSSTFVSRFVRAGLPSPKSYIVSVRLVYAAAIFDEGTHTIADVAYRLGYASPQSFGRHLRLLMGITPSDFRMRFPFNVMLERFLESHIVPFVAVLREFKPIHGGA
ncbi:MAG TPA: helix-turn-helix transcriptional regulator [Gemmatimonadales bacterium]|jgi:AraC-like DNA-binding protein